MTKQPPHFEGGVANLQQQHSKEQLAGSHKHPTNKQMGSAVGFASPSPGHSCVQLTLLLLLATTVPQWLQAVTSTGPVPFTLT
jgi:hypothetical protein